MIVAMVVAEGHILSSDKGQYLKTSYTALSRICSPFLKAEEYTPRHIAHEINRFYNEYVQEQPKIKKYFPNVVVWIDAVIFRIDCGRKYADVLNDSVEILKYAREYLNNENPFNKCEKYQQDILLDLAKVTNADNEIAGIVVSIFMGLNTF